MTKAQTRRGRRATGHLTIVGIGIKGIAQMTAEALVAIQQASLVCHAAADAATARWIVAQSRRAFDLTTHFASRRTYRAAHEAMVATIIDALDRGERVCAAFYGSPAVGVYPAHRALTRARARGHEAVMLPGVSAEACLFADLPLDPLACGYQSYDATDFVASSRRFDPTSALVLWQIGLFGGRQPQPRRDAGVSLLQKRLTRAYGAAHRVAVYVASTEPGLAGTCDWRELRQLTSRPLTDDATLFVPPVARRPSRMHQSGPSKGRRRLRQ